MGDSRKDRLEGGSTLPPSSEIHLIAMGINFSKKLVFGAAVINIILVGGLFYWLFLSSIPTEDLDRLCNTKLLESNLVGQSLPEYEFVSRDGANVYNDLTQGKVLLIVFLTHCEACMKEFDFLARNYSDRNSPFKVVAVTGESGWIVEQFVDTRKPDFPIYLDVRGSLMLKSRVSCTPTMFFMEDGVIRKIKVGLTEDYEDLKEGFQL